MTNNENERQYRVLDQMLSMHATLRDGYARRALALKVGLLSSSVALCGLTFLPDSVPAFLGLNPEGTRIALGICSIVIMMLSVVELLVAWETASGKHSQACEVLSSLKLKFRDAYSAPAAKKEQAHKRLTREYNRVMGSLPPIPDARFLSLKSAHLYKQTLSEEASRHPNVPVFLLRLVIRLRAIRDLLKGTPPSPPQKGPSDASS